MLSCDDEGAAGCSGLPVGQCEARLSELQVFELNLGVRGHPDVPLPHVVVVISPLLLPVATRCCVIDEGLFNPSAANGQEVTTHNL